MVELSELWREELLHPREIPGQGLCVLQRFVYTTALLTQVKMDGFVYSYAARYCYPTFGEAKDALAWWDGEADPPGEWIKEKVSGRSGPGVKVQYGKAP